MEEFFSSMNLGSTVFLSIEFYYQKSQHLKHHLTPQTLKTGALAPDRTTYHDDTVSNDEENDDDHPIFHTMIINNKKELSFTGSLIAGNGTGTFNPSKIITI